MRSTRSPSDGPWIQGVLPFSGDPLLALVGLEQQVGTTRLVARPDGAVGEVCAEIEDDDATEMTFCVDGQDRVSWIQTFTVDGSPTTVWFHQIGAAVEIDPPPSESVVEFGQ